MKSHAKRLNLFLSEFLPWDMNSFNQAKLKFMSTYKNEFHVWNMLKEGTK